MNSSNYSEIHEVIPRIDSVFVKRDDGFKGLTDRTCFLTNQYRDEFRNPTMRNSDHERQFLTSGAA